MSEGSRNLIQPLIKVDQKGDLRSLEFDETKFFYVNAYPVGFMEDLNV